MSSTGPKQKPEVHYLIYFTIRNLCLIAMESPFRIRHYFLLLFLFCFFQTPSFAIKKSYVVYLGAHSHNPKKLSSIDLNHVAESHYNILESYLESREDAMDSMFYSYSKHINGFAANLEEEVAARIAKHPKVVSVFLNRGRKLHTTRSWEFLGLEQYGRVPFNSIWTKARHGADTIIANLDTGVWPESKSFSDDGYGPIPSKWKGSCQSGMDSTFHCNRKLIGARYFNKGYAAAVGPLNATLNSPRDYDGHGSHTLSTAAGNFVSDASIFNYGKGTAKGGSPKARVAAYKVCWPPTASDECFDADVLAAFDEAISDGVDVLSVSLGGDHVPFFNDSIAIGSFHAVMHGIVVVCSAGNSGPTNASVTNLAPWQITVGASTMDREFPSYVVLGNWMHFKGESFSSKALPHGKFYPLINGADAKMTNASRTHASQCVAGAIDSEKAKGKIVVCGRGSNGRVQKGDAVARAGAVGMILISSKAAGYGLLADPHILPATDIKYTDGLALLSYINKTRSPVAYITHPITHLGARPAPHMAFFSSKGPNLLTPEILKPDITAPGVSVIAAYTEAAGPSNEDFDKRRVKYNALSGTSMSCPHISGIVGLLKTIYPTWSPAAIKSAIMTTSGTLDNNLQPILNASYVKATPFDYGAGHVTPNQAIDPGLIYDMDVHDYLNYLCTLGYNMTQLSLFSKAPYKCPMPSVALVNLNYPAIIAPNLSNSITVTRTVKNVGSPGIYGLHVKRPYGVVVLVEPKCLVFSKFEEEKSFNVTLKVKQTNAAMGYVFGEMIWSDGMHYVRSPIIVQAV